RARRFRPAHGRRGEPERRCGAQPRAASRRRSQEGLRTRRTGGPHRPDILGVVTSLRPLDQSHKLKDVLYEIRGAALAEADRLESDGHTILKLNTGNPAVFGFEAPFQIVRDMISAVATAHGYSDSRGI